MVMLLCLLASVGYQVRLPMHAVAQPRPVLRMMATAPATEDCAMAPVETADYCPADEVQTLELFRFLVPTLAGYAQ